MSSDAPRPFTLVAELTYRCPLHCPYCSNPTDVGARRGELSTDEWLRVLAEAEALGVVQLNLSGGEPLMRRDLETLVAGARGLDLYTNLITSGVPLSRERLERLKGAGLDSIQLSVQDTEPAGARRIAGAGVYEDKLATAEWIRELGIPLTLNIVLHRENLDRVADAIALAERLGAHRLELANAQYLGWALVNRDVLLPPPAQLESARRVAESARRRLRGTMEVLFVLPDYYAGTPKSCMDGWARRFVLINPQGLALPCHAALSLPGIEWVNVRARPLEWIWRESPGMNAFRGDDWMEEPCRTCDRRTVDFGGCRCQAFALAGRAEAADPVCALSPDHGLVTLARARVGAGGDRLHYRTMGSTDP